LDFLFLNGMIEAIASSSTGSALIEEEHPPPEA
jgi:hypothetical protein